MVIGEECPEEGYLDKSLGLWSLREPQRVT